MTVMIWKFYKRNEIYKEHDKIEVVNIVNIKLECSFIYNFVNRYIEELFWNKIYTYISS